MYIMQIIDRKMEGTQNDPFVSLSPRQPIMFLDMEEATFWLSINGFERRDGSKVFHNKENSIAYVITAKSSGNLSGYPDKSAVTWYEGQIK